MQFTSPLPWFVENPDPSVYLSDDYLVLDFEVDAAEEGYGSAVDPQSKLLLACSKRAGDKAQVKWAGEYDHKALLDEISQVKFIVAHNAKYELGWLRRCGADLRHILVFDTMLGEFVLLGNKAAGDEMSPPMSLSLDACCARRGMRRKDPAVDLFIKHGVKVSRIPTKWVEQRCIQDVMSTEQLFLSQRKQLHRTNRLPVAYSRCLLTPVLADMEFQGMTLDAVRVETAYNEELQKSIALGNEMDALTGGINWRSAPQAAKFLYDTLGFAELKRYDGTPKRTKPSAKFPEGQRLTNKKALEKLTASTPQQELYLDLRAKLGTASSALSKALDFFQGVCKEGNDTFHAEMHQTRTATHRLSSTGIPRRFNLFDMAAKSVAFQNMPRRFKRLFRARLPGWKIAEPDGSQLEFRIAVQLGQDAQGMKDLADPGWDAHCVTASEMEQKPYSDVYAGYMAGDKKATKWRQDAKSETFKPLYGGSKGTKKQERWYKAFVERYKGIAAVQLSWLHEVLRTKRLITPWGMRYYWPKAKLSNSGYCNVTTAVYNYPVQAFATAEVIPAALVYMWHRLGAESLLSKICLVNTVHDSIVAEIAPDMDETMTALAKQCFTLDVYKYIDIVYGFRFNVPLGTGIKIGTHWGEGPEQAFNIWPDGREEKVK